MSNFVPSGLGWRRDLPDRRDYTPGHDEVVKLLLELRRQESLPGLVDWREFCAGVQDQREIQSSVAHACAGLVQYFERRASGKLVEPSRMFIYKTARRLENWTGDNGAVFRTAWQAIVRFGIPPERNWPYRLETVDEEPDALAYSFAREYQSIRYVRLDASGTSAESVLHTVKAFLAAGFACALGFSACTSLTGDADVPFPTFFDGVRGGQAVVAVGYDDKHAFRSDKGALLIRSSWGPNWGDQGYGWLPYAYVRDQLAADFWTLLKPEWLASGEFSRPPLR